MFSRSNMDFCMGDLTSEEVNNNVWNVQKFKVESSRLKTLWPEICTLGQICNTA